MKTLKNLALFIILLIFFSYYPINSIKITTSNEKASNYLGLQSSQSNTSKSESVKPQNNLPTTVNIGLKLLKIVPEKKTSEICGITTQDCISLGVVLYGPSSSGTYAFIYVTKGSKIVCEPKSFGLTLKADEIGEQKCYTHEVEKEEEFELDKNLRKFDYQNTICSFGKPDKLVFVPQFAQVKCNKDLFKAFSPSDADLKKCSCSRTFLPSDSDLKDSYILFTIRSDGVKCLKDQASAKCRSFESEKDARNELLVQKTPDLLINIEKEMARNAINNLFNRLICPSESGLNFAVKFIRKENADKYEISCLSRNQTDCLEGVNAENACILIDKCSTQATGFNYVTCGNKDYIDKWDNNGFNTKLNTFCRQSLGWLTYNGVYQKDGEDRGIVMLPDGNLACIPNNKDPSICLKENSTKFLSSMITYYQTKNIYENLVFCSSRKLFNETNENHWCVKTLSKFSGSEVELGFKPESLF